MSPQQLETLKKKLKVAEAELKMRERTRNASEKGYRRVEKQIDELKRKIENGWQSQSDTQQLAYTERPHVRSGRGAGQGDA